MSVQTSPQQPQPFTAAAKTGVDSAKTSMPTRPTPGSQEDFFRNVSPPSKRPPAVPTQQTPPDGLIWAQVRAGDREIEDRLRSAEFLGRAPHMGDRVGLQEGDKICPCGLWRPRTQNGCECGQFYYWHHNELTPEAGIRGISPYVPNNPNHPRVLSEEEFRMLTWYQARLVPPTMFSPVDYVRQKAKGQYHHQ
jgi:hypothetical protein